MQQKPGAVKYKVLAGYMLVFLIAVTSVWFVYTEILKIALPAQDSSDNKKIIQISNTIADLYASEALGRSSILTGAATDYNKYNRLIDSINGNIEIIKKDVEAQQIPKFDSIQLLLTRKKNSVTGIIKYRRENTQENTAALAISGIYDVKDSILSTVKPVKIQKRHQWQRLVNALLTPRQLDSLSKLPVSNDSLAIAFEQVLSKLLIKDNKIKYQLYRKEQKLLEENRIISDQLRVILASVENEFLQKSYNKIEESKTAIYNTIKIMAWVGALTLFILIIFAWIILKDLNTNQKYRRRLEILNEENENLLRTKSMLMATVTHDLQTPLGSIIGFHDLMKSSGINTKQHQYLNNIKESTDYILKLVNDLLDFSKLENNRITIDLVPFNIKNSIDSTCRTLELIALNKNIELNWDIDDELNSGFVSDPYRLKQVLTNLISNSIKFTRTGSVEVSARIDNGNIIIAVIDTGIGIAKDKHADVFKEFTQAHSGIEKKFGGTGLGLTISKKITELLGGTITLESEEGQGSIFTIKLPCFPATLNDAEQLPANKTETDGHFLYGKKILFVDDDNVQLTLMKELFAKFPVTVNTLTDASLVVSILEQDNYDLVLTDIQMPIIDGFELVKLIRQHSEIKISALPVIALSGKRDLQASDFNARGFTTHHPKPVQLDALLAIMSGLIGSGKDLIQQPAITSPANNNGLYNLESLRQFTDNDDESLKIILNTFITSANENCEVLTEAMKNKDAQKIASTAHKMIPMLKQMEVHTIANLLMPLEDTIEEMDWQEIDGYVQLVCKKMKHLLNQFRLEVA